MTRRILWLAIIAAALSGCLINNDRTPPPLPDPGPPRRY